MAKEVNQGFLFLCKLGLLKYLKSSNNNSNIFELFFCFLFIPIKFIRWLNVKWNRGKCIFQHMLISDDRPSIISASVIGYCNLAVKPSSNPWRRYKSSNDSWYSLLRPLNYQFYGKQKIAFKDWLAILMSPFVWNKIEIDFNDPNPILQYMYSWNRHLGVAATMTLQLIVKNQQSFLIS